MWSEEAESSFQHLKQALITTPVLALPRFDLPFEVETDASNAGVGAVLMQAGHPLAFFSKALGPRNQGLSAYEKEFMAVLMAVDHWRPYLQTGEFIIRTDQCSLSHLDDQRLTTSWQRRALTKLLGLQYRIVYKKGAENRSADALSRRDGALLAISVALPSWLDDITHGYQSDSQACDLLQKYSGASDPSTPYTVRDGVIRYKGRVWLGSNTTAQDMILKSMHSSPSGGHSGIHVTYDRLKVVCLARHEGSSSEVCVQLCGLQTSQTRTCSHPRIARTSGSASTPLAYCYA